MAYNPGKKWHPMREEVTGGSFAAWDWVRDNLQDNLNVRKINVYYDMRKSVHAITWEEAE